MKHLTIYLAGPIKGLTQEESLKWRLDFSEQYGNCFEVRWPQLNDSRHEGKTGRELLEAIAMDERLDILNSDATIAYLYNNIESMGTAMGILYAYLSGRTVVVVKDNPEFKLSKMVEYHSHAVCTNFDDAVRFIRERHNRSSVKEILKREGVRALWKPERVTEAIQKAISNVFGSDIDNRLFQPPKAEKLMEAVVMKIEDDITRGRLNKDILDIENIQDTVEKTLMANTNRDEIKNLVKAYIIYRKKQEDKRNNTLNDRDIHEFITGQLHTIKGLIGNIGRSIDELYYLVDKNEIDNINRELDDMHDNFIDLKKYINITAREECDDRFKSEIINLNRFVESIISTFISSKSCFHIIIPNSLYIVTTPFKLKTIFRNLIENSIKHGFNDKKGNIYIKAKVVNVYDVEIDYWNDGNDITRQTADRIFSGYKDGSEATKDSWQHGMSQSKICINQMGGSIACLPIVLSQDGNVENLSLNQADIGKPWFCITLRNIVKEKPQLKKVLVADDVELHRKEVEKTLNRGEYEILFASNITEAEIVINKEELYGAVLDVDFREERNGLWLLSKIRNKSHKIKVAVLSAMDSASPVDWRKEAESNGAVTFDKGTYKRTDLLHYFDS